MTEPQAPLTEREALESIINAYDAYRRRGVNPAPVEYADVVRAIESARAALSTAPVQGVLPALPDPAVTSNVTDSVMRSHEVRSYSEAQMRDYGEACVRAALASAPHPPSNTLGDALTGPGHPVAGLPSVPIAACNVGDYVLATKYGDGDPGDRWAVGFYAGMERDRHMVKDSDGKNIHVGGYRGVIRIPRAVGDWLLKNASVLESSPPGAVNLLQMVSTQFNADRIDEETA